MLITDLIPTHNRLRNPNFLNTYDGSKRPFPVSVIHTEDGKLYLWDGHHYVSFLHKNGIKYLDDYTLTQMSYEKVMTYNFKKGYVTPFDMRIECRLENFIAFKEAVLYKWETYKYISECMVMYLPEEYKEKREVNNIQELINASRLSN